MKLKTILPVKEKANPEKSVNLSPRLELLRSFREGVCGEDAISLAQKSNKILASNIALDFLLSINKGGLADAGWYWTGTLLAYEKAGAPFGEELRYYDRSTGFEYIVPVPKKFQGKTDCAIASNHPDFSLEIKGSQRIFKAVRLDLLEDFPQLADFYRIDPRYGIPFGNPVETSISDARYFYRDESHVSLIARSVGDGIKRPGDWRTIMCFPFSVLFGVVSMGAINENSFEVGKP